MQICYYISKSNLAFKIYKKYICGFSPISKYDFLYIFTKNIKWLIYIKINKVVLSDEITKSKRGGDVMVEAVFTMFYKLGLIFFNDPKFNNVTPGKIADIFFSTPLNMLQKTLGLTAFFSIFINIGKIILLIVCLWICGKIIAIYNQIYLWH